MTRDGAQARLPNQERVTYPDLEQVIARYLVLDAKVKALQSDRAAARDRAFEIMKERGLPDAYEHDGFKALIQTSESLKAEAPDSALEQARRDVE